MKLAELIEGLDVIKIIGDAGVEISSLGTDSERLEAGALFFCIDGERYDSHRFAKEAMRGGAVAFISERPVRSTCPQVIVRNSRIAMSRIASVFYGRPQEKLDVIGVTGTNGKTTTVHMISAVLRQAGKSVGMIGTLGISYAEKQFPASLTTPDPIELFSTLSDMVKAGVDTVVMEVSAHALFYHKVEGIRFRAAVFTNCTQDHLDFFGSMSRYKSAKERLFRPSCCMSAILNFDDELGRKIASSGVPHISYALENPAEVFAVGIEERLDGVRFVLNLSDQLYEIDLALMGRHNVSNAMAAAACAAQLGIDLETIAKGLESVGSVEGRLERVASYRGAEIFVDFAHTPDGLEKSLGALDAHRSGKLICLFGCGGNRDKGKRELMGEVAGQLCDFCVFTSDNPRYEDPYDIIMEIETGCRRYSKNYVTVQDRAIATEYAIKRLQSGDILLIAGKGGETYQEIMGVRHPYDDKDVVRKIVASLGQT